MSGPLFSIVMPGFNRETTIGRAISSVLAQTLTDFELIVVDDGSTDGTVATVEAFDDPRIGLIRTAHLGAGAARNSGARETTGTWLTFLDSDDVADRDWLAALQQAATDESLLLTCGYRRVPGNSTMLPGALGPELGSVTAVFLAGCYALRREIFNAVGGFSPDSPAAQHTELAMRLIPHLDTAVSIAAIDRALITVHADTGRSRVRNDDDAVLGGAEYLLQHHHARLELAPRKLADTHGVAGVSAARLGDFGRARQHFDSAVRADLRNAKRWLRSAVVRLPGVRSQVWRRRSE